MVAPGKQQFQAVTPREKRSAVEKIMKNDEHITLLLFIWADGYSSVPGLILPHSTLPGVPDELLEEFHWAGEASGWITTEIFHSLIEKVLIPDIKKRREDNHLPANEPALLLMDNHATHASPQTLQIL